MSLDDTNLLVAIGRRIRDNAVGRAIKCEADRLIVREVRANPYDFTIEDVMRRVDVELQARRNDIVADVEQRLAKQYGLTDEKI